MKKNYIPISILFALVFGNAVGLIIGITFFLYNIGIGLLIGNSAGLSIGLMIGAILNYKKNR